MKLFKTAGIGVTLVIAGVLLAGVAQAHAESPDILVGQDMSVGSRSQSVVVLQGVLSELGYLNIPAGTSLGYFGPLTKNATVEYQEATRIEPADGHYDGLTMEVMHLDLSNRGYLSLLGW